MRGLPKYYLLHTNLSKFGELGKTCQATCFPLSTLNHWSFTEHTSWPSKSQLQNSPEETHELRSWAKNEMLCHELKLWALMRLYRHKFWTMGFGIILRIRTLLGFKIDSPKIHDNIDVVRVANEMKPCGVKNLPSTMCYWYRKIIRKFIYCNYINHFMISL